MANPYINAIHTGKTDIWRIDYGTRTDGQAVYFGYAPTGTSESDSEWLIYKFTYDLGNPAMVTQRDISWGSWADRATLSYGQKTNPNIGSNSSRYPSFL